eukprot:2605543-Pleurochrysis_carterae.AAC.4
MADLLSIWSDVGSVGGSPRPSNRVRKYTASFAASDAAIISLRKTKGQRTAAFLTTKRWPPGCT